MFKMISLLSVIKTNSLKGRIISLGKKLKIHLLLDTNNMVSELETYYPPEYNNHNIHMRPNPSMDKVFCQKKKKK